MLKVYFPAKKKSIRREEKIIEQQPGLSVSIYRKVHDFCQEITHSRLTPFLAYKSKLERYMIWNHFSSVCSGNLR